MKKLFSIMTGLVLALTLFITPVAADEDVCKDVCQTKRVVFSNGVYLDYLDIDCDGKHDFGVLINPQGGIGIITNYGIEDIHRQAKEQGIMHKEVVPPNPCGEKTGPDPARFKGHKNCDAGKNLVSASIRTPA